MSHSMVIKGRTAGPDDTPPQSEMQIVTGEYFNTIGVPLMKGRTFDDRDRLGPEEVAVISRSLAQRYWHDSDPLGGQILTAARDTCLRVGGVAGEVRDHALDQDTIDVCYVALAQPPGGGNILLRSNVDPAV